MHTPARIAMLLLIVFFLKPVGTTTSLAAPTIAAPLVEPAVLRALETHPDTPLRVIVTLRPAEMSAVVPTTPTAEAVNGASRVALVEALQDDFAAALEPVARLLAEAYRQDEVLARRDLWIIRATALTARPALVRRLMASPAVAEIRLDHYEPYIPPEQPGGVKSTEVTTPPWGLTQIHAPEVWGTLGISGTGAVVAVMDTGVDLLHPALSGNYRGNLGHGLFEHTYSWFDAVNNGVYPYDDYGHGTHVAGTAVGAENIGVAPGARWIGVKVLSGEGYGYDSWIHAGFQWLLAPGGDPTMTPDVVNNSWASTLSSQTTFAADIALLQAAGILPLFAAGNEGPTSGTLGAPASNPGVFAVGASDPDDDVASFSSRGPSPWDEIKPYIVAPGVNVLSSIPGGVYNLKNGTSMATPHVTGLVALLHSAAPTLSVGALTAIITQTTVPLSTTLPNNASGWGRIDAFAAVVVATHAGLVTGNVASPNRQGIANATLIAMPRGPQGNPGHTVTTAGGDYALALSPAVYDITASAFGSMAETQWNIPVFTDTRRQLDFTLLPLPTGTLRGHVTVAGTATPPTHTIIARALNTPVTANVNAAGDYSLKLPAGVYTIEMRGLGYRVATTTVSIVAGEDTLRDFTLTPAPTLLLVDEGAWYYDSQTSYWKASLDALAYTYDEWPIKFPPAETPISTTLAPYDIVLWSSPQGSPGLVNGGEELNAYLQRGGRLLLSGQDVAYFDGGGYDFDMEPYFSQTLGAGYVADKASSRRLTGLGPFSGITVTIEGGDGADNQSWPDVVNVRDPDRAELLWQYADGTGGGGIGTATCTPYRAVFLAFGYEAIAARQQREDILARSFDWLMTPPPAVALELQPLSDPLQLGLPGEAVTYTLRLRHTGYGGHTTPVTLTVRSDAWPAAVTPAAVTLAACESLTLTVVVTIPAESEINVGNALTVTAASPFLATETGLNLRVKTPAPVLLVDDDRWYPMEERYMSVLTARHIPFDVWDTAENSGGTPGARSPALNILQRYPLIVWFTGYDWYAPVLPQEEKALLAYLEGGGRLLLSSQDFLYYHSNSPLARRLGVAYWDENLNPTRAFGVPDHPAGGTWGPVKLDFPFKNWADAIEPAPEATPVIRGQRGQPLGVAATAEVSNSRTLFYAFPLETLPFDTRVTVLEQGVGWLSPLGTSRWTVTPTVPLPGERVTNTLILRNDAAETLTATVSHILPTTVTLAADPLPPAWDYSAVSRTLTWSGEVQPHRPLTLTWVVAVTGNPGAIIPLSLTLGLPAWGFAFDRAMALHVTGADLSASAWLSPEWATIHSGTPVTLAFALHNAGPGDVNGGTARLWLTGNSSPLTATLPYTGGWSVSWWEGNLMAGATRILTVPLRAREWERPLRVDAILEDHSGQRWEQRLWLHVEPWQLYLPVILK
ncbi:MAG TPA: S8 family serine peptidase [Anaerolineae bacterium]|nr:S8 family serine peptidase [Anaerolineae bacterium]HQH38743.1 S8 family serine peptidase [Anaerolineae bacterium]